MRGASQSVTPVNELNRFKKLLSPDDDQRGPQRHEQPIQQPVQRQEQQFQQPVQRQELPIQRQEQQIQRQEQRQELHVQLQEKAAPRIEQSCSQQYIKRPEPAAQSRGALEAIYGCNNAFDDLFD